MFSRTNMAAQAANSPLLAASSAMMIALVMLTLALHGPIAQPADYHHFADQRTLLSIPHAMDVLSNLPFLLVGLWGLSITSTLNSLAQPAWRVFFFSVSLTCFGSSFYHGSPNDFGLLIDRLPIAWATAALSCALLAERLDARFAKATVLFATFIVSSLTVLYWYQTQVATHGFGDLRPYLFVQFLPMLLVPLCVFLSRAQGASLINGKGWAIVLGLYALAKVFEIADHQLFNLLGFISGHTIKHLLAAMAAGYLAHTLSIAHTKLRFAV